jgi:beta-lactamase regulating signal transducer with metallopeptidase domain
MIAWMLYSVLVALFVAVAARAAEWVTRLAGRPVRWIWGGALLIALSLAAVAPYRQSLRGAALLPATDAVAIQLSSTVGIVAAQRSVPALVNLYSTALWSALSLSLLALLVAVDWRMLRARRHWPTADVAGVGVRVAPHIGPAVVGFLRPEIVVPQWLLARAAEEQRLVVAHEREHVTARDPLLLGAACVAAAVMPWNPAVWYMLSRLRLSVELDCDARVLRRGVAPRSYGALLIDVAENASAFRLSALALADDSSHLHQRILAMKLSTPRFALLRGSVVGLLGLTALLAACEAKLPTAAEVDRMDATSAEQAAHKMSLLKVVDSTVQYVVDGAVVTAAQAHAYAPETIASVRVSGRDLNGKSQVSIVTKRGADSVKATTYVGDTLVTAFRGARKGGPGSMQTLGSGAFSGIILINGVRSTSAALQALDRETIKSVEVVKGPAAAATFGTDATDGAIIVVTGPKK